MTVVTQLPEITVNATFTMTEPEMRAMKFIIDYGTDDIMRAFNQVCGYSGMDEHSKGLRMFFDGMKRQIPPILSRTDAARKAFEEK